ncbi:MAG: DUF3617 domain-containing protein [Alphaproteobacteria bacterium]|nr:DUF3617 domain-containing protein [Alphaproteobacteria bacterium]MBV9370049.1 DUF3617 domain-containing protein [Alphaproteobacteria bacterium]MBV9900723.1 DUF3617 domain-containing protein [Alphaproteobacteria bacterium]
MRVSRFTAALGLVMLAGCGKSGDGGAGGNAAAARQSGGAPAASAGAAGAAQIDPGEWEVAFETTDVSGSGLPPAAIAAMRGQKETRRECITPEEARKPIKMNGEENKDCDYSKFSMGGGRMSGTITCGNAKTARVALTMNGTFSARSYDYAASMTTEARGVNMTMGMKATGRRVGDCAPGSDESK